MFSVSNVYRQVTGVKGHYYDLSTNHEFSSSEVDSSEQKVTDIIHMINGYVYCYENPFSHQCNEKTLHNIMTKQIANEVISNLDLLTVQKLGKTSYIKHKTERYVKKFVQISAIIYRSNIKTFESSEVKDKTQGSNAKINRPKTFGFGSCERVQYKATVPV